MITLLKNIMRIIIGLWFIAMGFLAIPALYMLLGLKTDVLELLLTIVCTSLGSAAAAQYWIDKYF